ncbi:MAG TPA: signal peptidase I [Candidatus Pacearchaeota archaeon]|nr:signal peptidase I [Candidatus Pacearchaeota archaeon]
MPPIEIKENQESNVSRRKLILMFLAIIVIVSFLYFIFIKKDTRKEIVNNDCFVAKQRTIDGTSMSPLLQNGETVTTYENFYDCNEIQKSDIIIFNFKTREGDYIKKIVGMPNEKLEFEEGYIKINGEFVLNSEGSKYKLNSSQQKILSIPLVDNQIPRNGYLVLGDNVSNGTFDSRQFGYINKSQIIGKVNK